MDPGMRIFKNSFFAVGAERNSAADAYHKGKLDFGKLTQQLAITSGALPEHSFVTTGI